MSQKTLDKNADALILERIIDAPRDRVWKAWTEPEQVVKWWGPNGFTTPVCKIDFRVGGTSLYCMRSPEGNDFWSGGVYQEIIPHERIVCTDYFTNEEGNPVSASKYGMADWPDETLITVTFEDINGKTKLTVRHESIPPSKDRDCADQGWGETLDRLAEFVEKA